MNKKFFITGTDTEIGKTYIGVGLIKAFNNLGYSTLGVKPVSSDCFWKDNTLYNGDALQLQKASSFHLEYDHINPFAFEPPIAPNIAANSCGKPLTLELINSKISHALNSPVDIHIVEGFGGWFAPLNNTESMADFVIQNNLPVILVVGIRLGCLNHSLLTYHAIKNSGLPFAGWIANCFQPAENVEDIVGTLKEWLKIPFLGLVDYNQKPEEVLNYVIPQSLICHPTV